MKRRGHSLIEMIAVMGISFLVLSLVGTLHLGVTRAVETETARSELLGGAREVSHPLKAEVREASALSVSPSSLLLVVRGQRVEYRCVPGGLSRRGSAGTRLLGTSGLAVQFRPLGGRGVVVSVRGTRTVRGRKLTLSREMVVARRVP